MNFLQDIFSLILDILYDVILTDFFTSICWMFILVLIALILHRIWCEVVG